MVCAKCQKLQKQTQLATPGVKRKNDIYYGSSTSSASAGSKGKPSATLGQTGISKVWLARRATRAYTHDEQSKLLSKSAKNPYAAYASSCKTCKTKVEQGRTYCQSCAYKANACAMCGKSSSKSAAGGAIAIDGQKRSAK